MSVLSSCFVPFPTRTPSSALVVCSLFVENSPRAGATRGEKREGENRHRNRWARNMPLPRGQARRKLLRSRARLSRQASAVSDIAESHASIRTRVHITTILLLPSDESSATRAPSSAQPSPPRRASSGATGEKKLRLGRCPQGETAAKGGSRPRRGETFHTSWKAVSSSEASTTRPRRRVRVV